MSGYISVLAITEFIVLFFHFVISNKTGASYQNFKKICLALNSFYHTLSLGTFLKFYCVLELFVL